ncbi:MAG TPA: hypothetical protein PKA14_11470 [Leptospiraceae bacterium]|nr:hypothetical protein [Leptospiraceae bacterium]
MKSRKETAGAVIFCIVNGILAMQCLTIHIQNRIVGSEKDSERTFPVMEKSGTAAKNPWIELGTVSRIFFPFENGKLFCADLKPELFDVHMSEENDCSVSSSAQTVDAEFIYFPGKFQTDEKLKILYSPEDRHNLLAAAYRKKTVSIFDWGNKTSYALRELFISDSDEKLNQLGKQYTVIIIMDTKNTGLYGIVPKKPVFSQSSFVHAPWLSSKTENSASLWRILEIPAFVTDIITFPIQFVGGWIYIMLFGFKK